MLQGLIVDELTDARSRTNIKGVLNDCKEQVDLSQSELIVAVIDIDHLKTINDTYGQSVGDSLPVETAQRILRAFPNGSLIQMAADEFLLLHKLEKETELESIKNQITEIFTKEFHFDGFSVPASLSVGISVYPRHSKNLESLIRSADYAMYHAKKNSLGTSVFNEAMRKEIGRTALLEELEELNLEIEANQCETRELSSALRRCEDMHEFLISQVSMVTQQLVDTE